MIKKVLVSLLLLFLLSYADILDEFFNNLRQYEGVFIEFSQISQIEGFDKQIFEGKATILKDGRLKLEYTKPEKQYILIEGKRSISYLPSENQVIISKLEDDIALIKVFKIFSGSIDIKNIFNLNINKNLVVLTPKDKNIKDLQKVEIYFKDKNPYKLVLYDQEENIVIINIKNIKYLDKKPKLHINYPENTEVIEY